MSAEPKLWIISIPGPDEIYAAPSYDVAQLMKAAHDRSMTEWLAGQHAKGEDVGMDLDREGPVDRQRQGAGLPGDVGGKSDRRAKFAQRAGKAQHCPRRDPR